jgi:hypothetical protein
MCTMIVQRGSERGVLAVVHRQAMYPTTILRLTAEHA